MRPIVRDVILSGVPQMNIEFKISVHLSDMSDVEDRLKEEYEGLTGHEIPLHVYISSYERIVENITIAFAKKGMCSAYTDMLSHEHQTILLGFFTRDGKGKVKRDAIKVLELLVGNDEGLSTASGSLYRIIDPEELYAHTNPTIGELIDVTVVFEEGPDAEKLIGHIDDEADLNEIYGVSERFLAPREPSGVFAKAVNGVYIYTARCPGCDKLHGNFRSFEQASSNRQCRFCTRDYVDKMTKVTKTKNFKHLLKKDHESRASTRYR